MKKVAAVKGNDAEIDWAAEFGEDDEFTVEEHPPDQDEEVEIVLKHSRGQEGSADQAAAGFLEKAGHSGRGSCLADARRSI